MSRTNLAFKKNTHTHPPQKKNNNNNLICFGLSWDCSRCKGHSYSHYPSNCIVCSCTKYWPCPWGILPELWRSCTELGGMSPCPDNQKSVGNTTEKLLMLKYRLQASSLSGYGYSFLTSYLFYLEMRFAKYKKAALKNYQNTLLCFSYFQTLSNIYITRKEAKTCNWVERRVANSKYIESSETQNLF